MQIFFDETSLQKQENLFEDIQIVRNCIALFKAIEDKGEEIMLEKDNIIQNLKRIIEEKENERLVFKDEFTEDTLLLSLEQLKSYFTTDLIASTTFKSDYKFTYFYLEPDKNIIYEVTYNFIACIFEQKQKDIQTILYAIHPPFDRKYLSIIKFKLDTPTKVENFICLNSAQDFETLIFQSNFREKLKTIFFITKDADIKVITTIYEKERAIFNANLWQPDSHYFPMEKVAKRILDYSKYQERIDIVKNYEERKALNTEVGTFISELNGYKDCSTDIARKNKNRIIFEAGEGGHKIYLSIDFKTGAFEVCNFKGNFIDEYNFEGESTNKQNKGNHDIEIC
ncbi:MAG: hypothetical protein ACKVTZ_06785 [Bacteroidia bacterium]